MSGRQFPFGEYLTKRIEMTPEGPAEGKAIFRFLAKMQKLTWQEGDEFWEYNTPEEMWKRKQGEAGYAWYRNGAFLTAMPTQTWRVEDCLTHRIEATPEKLTEMQLYLEIWGEQDRQTWQEGDELWEFSSPDDTWARLEGRSGTAWIRNGKVIAVFDSKMN